MPDAPAAAPVRPALLQELLQRLLGSLQHAQAAAAAATADDEPAAAAAAAVLALLRRADEHGYSLEGYAGGLHKMLDSLGWLADRQAGASELQARYLVITPSYFGYTYHGRLGAAGAAPRANLNPNANPNPNP